MTRTHAKGSGKSKLVRNLPGDKQRNFAVAARRAKLTREEEAVLRMRKGVTATPDQALEYRGKGNDLTRKRLADMERDNLRRLAEIEKNSQRTNRPLKLVHPDLA